MANWSKQKDSVKQASPPAFDPKGTYTDAIQGQDKYWVQNGWLYKRGSGEPVREA